MLREAPAAAGETSASPTASRKRRTVFLSNMHEGKTDLKGRSVQQSSPRLSPKLAVSFSFAFSRLLLHSDR